MANANGSNSNLAWLLSPLDPAAFFNQYWEQQPLHLPNRGANYYRELLSAEALEEFINSSDLRYPALQLARDGHYYAPKSYTRDIRHGSEIFAGVPELDQVATEYRNGATLTLPALHRTWKPLRELCAALEGELDHAVHANAYMTPGNAIGFAPHYDVHEVFVLQIAGPKRWSLFEPPTSLPHRTQPFDPQTYKPGSLLATIDLNPGDLLYLPRGYIHTTATSQQYSAHVTIGISVYTWADLMREHQQSAIEQPQLRKALPPGFTHAPDLEPALRQQLLAAISGLGSAANPDQLLESFAQRMRSTRSQRPERLKLDVRVLDRNALLRVPGRDDYRLRNEGDRTVLEFQGKRYVLPAEAAPLMQAICERECFRPAELPAAHEEAARLGVSRYLFEIGFLTLDH